MIGSSYICNKTVVKQLDKTCRTRYRLITLYRLIMSVTDITLKFITSVKNWAPFLHNHLNRLLRYLASHISLKPIKTPCDSWKELQGEFLARLVQYFWHVTLLEAAQVYRVVQKSGGQSTFCLYLLNALTKSNIFCTFRLSSSLCMANTALNDFIRARLQ